MNELKFIKELNAQMPAMMLFIGQKQSLVVDPQQINGINPMGDDVWFQFSDKIDLQFSINDDPDAVSFNQWEVWAYPMGLSNTGEVQTDMSFEKLVWIFPNI